MKKKIIISVVAILVAIQFFSIDKENPVSKPQNDFIEVMNPPEVVQHVLESGTLRYTQNTLVTEDSFSENLKQTWERGFPLSMQEFEEGINAIAVPILDHRNQPLASVAIAGPSYRLTKERIVEIGQQFIAAVREIATEVEIANNTK